MNGNGWVKPLSIGVATFVLGAAIVGAASNSISNSIEQGKMEVIVSTIKEDVDANTERTDGIDVMQKQLTIIERDVRKILDNQNK